MKKTWMLVLLISLGLNLGMGFRLWRDRAPQVPEVTTLAPAGDADGMRPGPPDSLWVKTMITRRMRHMTAALSLRPDQVEAMQKIQQQRGDWIRNRGRRMDGLRARIRSLLSKPTADPAQVRALIHEMGSKQTQLDSLVTETIMGELAILDPDQREMYLRMLPFERQRFGESGRKSRRGPGRGGWGSGRQ